MEYESYPVFKGLQMPLQLFGLQGRFLIYAAVIVATVLFGFILMYSLISATAGFLFAIVSAGGGGAFFYRQYRKGLHSKRLNRDIYIYKNVYVTYSGK